MFALTEIGDQVFRGHDRLGLVDQGGGCDARGGAQGLQYLRHLGLILVAGSQPFPHEGDGTEPHHFDAAIGQCHHRLDHLQKHLRVGPVQIPLMVVEGGPDPCAEFGIMGEIARRVVGKHLHKRFGIAPGLSQAVNHPVVILIFRRAVLGPGRRFMLLGGAVQHQIDAQADAACPHCAGHRRQILHRAQCRDDRAMVHHEIAAVTVTRARLQAGHEMHIGRAKLGQILQLFDHAGQREVQAVNVKDTAGHIGALKPVGFQIAGKIKAAQGRAGGRAFCREIRAFSRSWRKVP